MNKIQTFLLSLFLLVMGASNSFAAEILNEKLSAYEKEYELKEELRNEKMKNRDETLYNYFYEKLNELDPKVAKEKIKNDPIFRNNLSNNAYMKLYYYFS